MGKSVTVLHSGGIDSSACIHYFKNLKYDVTGLFIEYGQPSMEKEKTAVGDISKYFGIQSYCIKLPKLTHETSGMMKGRNLLFLSLAYFGFKQSNGIISLGIHSGTSYPDCSHSFINKVQELLDLYSDGNILIDCPFVGFNKREIFEYCKLNNIPLDLTYSCERGLIQPCGQCVSCKDLLKFHEIENP